MNTLIATTLSEGEITIVKPLEFREVYVTTLVINGEMIAQSMSGTVQAAIARHACYLLYEFALYECDSEAEAIERLKGVIDSEFK